MESYIFATEQTALSLPKFIRERKVRTPQGNITVNGRLFQNLILEKGPVQQKGCTDHAVVKPGKLYVVKCHVNQHLRLARSLLEGRQLEVFGNKNPR